MIKLLGHSIIRIAERQKELATLLTASGNGGWGMYGDWCMGGWEVGDSGVWSW